VADLRKTDLCPCQSRRESKNCCWRGSRFYTAACVTGPTPPQTRISHPKCYAAALRDCSQEISREHYISGAILRKMHRLGSVTFVGGPWGSEGRTLAPSAATAKVLCARHNNALSGLDAIAGRFFDATWSMSPGRIEKARPNLVCFNGHDLERWMLKVLLGAGSAPLFNEPGRTGSPVRIDPAVLPFLFGKAILPHGLGLYVWQPLDRPLAGIRIEQVKLPDGRIWALRMTVSNLVLFLRLVVRDDDPQPGAYRPTFVEFRYAGHQFRLGLSWDVPVHGTGLEVMFQDAPPPGPTTGPSHS
jgi:hypothetical protein